jgi:hypothetical protein
MFVAVRIAGVDRRERRQERRLRAQGLALLLHTEMVGFRGSLESAAADDFRLRVIEPPPILLEYSDQLYLLGPAGGALLQMISTLNANDRFVADVTHFGTVDDPEALNGIRRSLRLALDCCNEAIAGLDQLIQARRT